MCFVKYLIQRKKNLAAILWKKVFVLRIIAGAGNSEIYFPPRDMLSTNENNEFD